HGASSLRQFFRFWTAKEAYLKATGSGLSYDPAKVEANFGEGRFTSAANPGAVLPYALHEIPTANQFLVSMAHEICRPKELRLQQVV
ncbi:MAG: 4'-phosphopantetheinyl transferase superfamily protein, partial [Verrucomicrobiales bacterium]